MQTNKGESMKKELEILSTRYSCREFLDTKLSSEDLRQILEIARLSPSSLGLEPWKFILTEDKVKLQELAQIANKQIHVAQAAAVIIIVSRLDFPQYFESKLRKRKMSEAELNMRLKTYQPFLEGMNEDQKLAYAREQAHIALASILYAVNALDIGTCTIGGFDKKALNDYLKLDTNKEQASLMIALGKKASTQIPEKTRFDFDEVVRFL